MSGTKIVTAPNMTNPPFSANFDPDAILKSIASDPSKLAEFVAMLEEQKKAEKARKRQEAEDARRERRGLPRKGEATEEQAERIAEIMEKVDPDLVLSFLGMNKPATLIQTIEQMERLEFPWNQEDADEFTTDGDE